MSGERSKRIIAVFGGSKERDVLSLAEMLGSALARAGQVLLSGGREPGKDAVKTCAISGAGASPWVGVDRKDSPGVVHSRVGERGFRVVSDLGHKRNYLEACMCDAAIALRGEEGTLSEVTSALALQRPLAFVGDHWKDVCDLDGDRGQVLTTMVDTTLRKLASGRPSAALDPQLERQIFRPRLERLPSYMFFEASVSAEDVVAWLMSTLPEAQGLPGNFPAVEGHEAAREAYEEWLREHGR